MNLSVFSKPEQISCNLGPSLIYISPKPVVGLPSNVLHARPMKEEVTRSEGVTELLIKWSCGDRRALDELMPLVYDELRRLASVYLRRKAAKQTLQPTSLVHEAYVRLADQSRISMQHRAQFFGLAAKVMRDILVDHARRRLSDKRGGRQLHVSLSQVERKGYQPEFELLALDRTLRKLAKTNPQHSRVVELRFFGGLTIEETALAMSLSHATTERYWSFARAWLRRELAN